MKNSNNTPDLLVVEQPKGNDNIITIPMNATLNSTPKAGEKLPHEEVLKELISQVEKIDFEAQVHPQVERLRKQLKSVEPDSDQYRSLQDQLSRYKLNKKHYQVLAVEEVLQLSKNNDWGLCKNHDFIYLFNGAYWSEIDNEEFQKFLGEAGEKMGIGVFDARYYLFREQLFKQFLSTAYLPTPVIDVDTVLINLQNGTFEVTPQGTKLRSFNREDFLTYQLPFEYDHEAKAPIFEKYLNRVLPDIESRKVLAEYLGYVFMKHGSSALKGEKALILYGGGANGKSVFFEVVNALLGTENVSNYSMQSLTNENGYYRAKIANKLVNYASEINGNLEADTFKKLVSGEPTEARLPYGEPFIMTQFAKLIFNSNELPKDVEHTNAYFRRFLIIPFNVTIPVEEQDKNLHTKIIKNELSGVFNWVLEGLGRLLKQNDFSNCDAAQKALEEYRIESDSVQLYLQEYNYIPSLTATIPLQILFTEYRSYSIDNGFRAVSTRTFAGRLRSVGYTTERISAGTVVFIENKVSF